MADVPGMAIEAADLGYGLLTDDDALALSRAFSNLKATTGRPTPPVTVLGAGLRTYSPSTEAMPRVTVQRHVDRYADLAREQRG